jgi:speckle-type POZ protein
MDDNQVYKEFCQIFDLKVENLNETKVYVSEELRMDFNTKWKIEINETTGTYWISSNIDLYLQLIDTDLTQVWAKLSVSFDGTIFRSNDFKKMRKENKALMGQLFLDVWPNSLIRTRCEIQVSVPEEEYFRRLILKGIQTNFRSLLETGLLSDFTLVVNGSEFAVHSSILIARSPFFAAMLYDDMKEKRECKATLEEIETNVFEALLKFIYYGNVSQIEDLALKLFIAADKYDIRDLRTLCGIKVYEVLTFDNVFEALKFADLYNLVHLKDRSIDFFIENYRIFKSSPDIGLESFAKKNPNLLLDILDKVLINRPEFL